MSKQKIPNINSTDIANFGLLSPAGADPQNTSKSINQATFPTSDGVVLRNKFEKARTVVKTITSAQLLALNTTPITMIPAPGANLMIKIVSWTVRHGTGTAYAGIAAGEDLVLKYTDASGAVAATAIETTGFLDQTTAQIRLANALAGSGAAASTPADLTPVANAAIVCHLLSGNITTGDFPLYLFIEYDIVPTDFTA